MPSSIPKDLTDEIGGTIDYCRLVGIGRIGGHKPHDFYHAGDIVQANFGINSGKSIERRDACLFLGLFRGDFGTNLAGQRQGAFHEGKLARGPDLIAYAHGRHVGR